MGQAGAVVRAGPHRSAARRPVAGGRASTGSAAASSGSAASAALPAEARLRFQWKRCASSGSAAALQWATIKIILKQLL